jgi:polysaccharide biosynthesis transport protein
MSRYSEVPAATGFAEVFRGIRQHKMLLMSLPLLGVLAGELFLMSNKPAYLAEAQVIVENLATPFDKPGNLNDQSTAESLVNDRMVQSQVSVIKSSDIDARVVDQLGLDQKPEYNTRLKASGMVSTLLIALGLKDDPALFEPKELAAKNLSNALTVYGIPDSNVIGIKSVSLSGGFAAATANAIAETYVLSTHERGASTNDRARTWLSKQIDDLRSKVSQSEAAVEKYRADAGLLKGTSATLGTQQISDLNAQIIVAETAKGEAEARANEIRQLLASRGSVDASADVLSSPAVQSLRQQQVSAQRKLSELSATYLPGHPKMIAAQKELDTINGQIRAEALKVVDSLQGQAKIADARANALRASLDKMKGAEAENNFSDVKLKELQREADANRALLESMLSRYADVNARQDTALQPGFARLIQRATVPAAPYFPKTGPVLILSLLAGLALALGLAFILEVLAVPLRRRDDEMPVRRHALHEVETNSTAVPEFNVGPFGAAATAGPQIVKKGGWPEAKARAFGTMPAALTSAAALELLQSLVRGEAQVLADGAAGQAAVLQGFRQSHGYSAFAFTTIGSAAPNAALAVLAIGRTLAAKGEKVIALDVAQPGSGFDALLQLPPAPGLTDLISGTADFTKAVSRDTATSLHVIRLGQFPTAEAQSLLAGRLDAIIQALRGIYGYVLLHAGEAQAGAAPLIACADMAVIMASATRIRDAEQAATTLEQGGKMKTLLLKLEPDRSTPRAEQASA